MMRVFAIVPVKIFEKAKTRLSSILDAYDRAQLSSLMLEDTLHILSTSPLLTEVVIVSSDKRAEELAVKRGAKFLHEEEENGVNSAIALADRYSIEKAAEATIVIPHDLPLLSTTDISEPYEMVKEESRCMVITPSLRYDGTNMLLRKPPCVIGTSYDNDSYNTHVNTAIKLGVPVKRLFSKTLMLDIDTPEDILSLITDETARSARSIEFIKSKLQLR
jgi:2-phospho-L-lactate guanylyltransferase